MTDIQKERIEIASTLLTKKYPKDKYFCGVMLGTPKYSYTVLPKKALNLENPTVDQLVQAELKARIVVEASSWEELYAKLLAL